MSSAKHCCVPGCEESQGMHALHRFPNPAKERKRFNDWLYAVGGDIIGLENEHIYKYRRVCRRHFEDKYLCRSNKISNIAIPTLNMPGPLTCRKYTFGERKPMRLIQTGDENVEPSTSRGLTTVQEDLSTKNKPLQHLQTIPEVPTGVTESQNLSTTHMEISMLEDTLQKENIDPLVRANIFHPNIATTSKALSSCVSVIEKDDCQKNVEKVARHNQSKVIKKTKQLFLTEAEIELHKKINAAKVLICKYKNKAKRQSAELRAAKKFATNPEFLNAIENCSTAAKILMQIQWRESNKKVKGRRFTFQDKINCLSILKQSPKGYRFLRKIFILPSPQTLIKVLQKTNLHPGINTNLFEQLKIKTNTMKNEEKLAVLIFDEVSLKPGLTYNERKNIITGFVDDGEIRIPEFANHAQVFMLRGVIYNYKQVVAYTFSASATKGPELAKQLKNVIKKSQEAGFKIVASVCDQGTNNRQAIKLLLEETRGTYLRRGQTPKEKIILINDHEIVPLYDPPHLLKAMRNNLITKNLKYEMNNSGKVAKWEHLYQLHDKTPIFEGVQLVSKLTENIINPDKINKMKVKHAAQVFSRTVATSMGCFSNLGILPPECSDTASLLHFMDDVFDSVNGSATKNYHAKPLLGPVTPTSEHHKNWINAIKVFKSMKFVNPAGKIDAHVPTINNWVWTLEAFEVLLKKLQIDHDITSVWMRHLNQDPLENFFGAVRSHGCRNNNPSCDQFENSYATLLVNNLNSGHIRGKNCEGDFCDALHTLLITENSEAKSTETLDFSEFIDMELLSIQELEKDPGIMAPLEYVNGYFLKKLKSKIFKGCDICTSKLTAPEGNESVFIKFREYAGRRWLCYPSSDLNKLLMDVKHIIHEIIKKNIYKKFLKEYLKTAILAIADFNVFANCAEHKEKNIDYVLNLIIRFMIYNYCKNINKIMTGKIKMYDSNDLYQIKAKKICESTKKKKIIS